MAATVRLHAEHFLVSTIYSAYPTLTHTNTGTLSSAATQTQCVHLSGASGEQLQLISGPQMGQAKSKGLRDHGGSSSSRSSNDCRSLTLPVALLGLRESVRQVSRRRCRRRCCNRRSCNRRHDYSYDSMQVCALREQRRERTQLRTRGESKSALSCCCSRCRCRRCRRCRRRV